jgi:hypothetical protein
MKLISAQSRGGGEPVGHTCEADDDLGEVLQAAAAAQLPGVVHGGLEAQDVLVLVQAFSCSSPTRIRNQLRPY